MRKLLLAGSALVAIVQGSAAWAQPAPAPAAAPADADNQDQAVVVTGSRAQPRRPPATASPVPAGGRADGDNQDRAVVVPGSRAQPRSRLDTVSPVDVLTSEALSQQGTTEIAEALSSVAPSIDFPRPSVVDGTDSIRPATLRGL